MQSSAVERGLHFLHAQRSKSGWWYDFRTSEGTSDEWVTAYTGYCLANIPMTPAADLARSAWDKLRRRRWWLPGWAYNYGVPLDADSTIWAIRLAEALHSPDRRVSKAYRFLQKHVQPNGGLSTYTSRSRIARHIRLPGGTSATGWQSPHVCVSAAAANLDDRQAFPNLDKFLIHNQHPDGNWTAYWWSDAEFPTAMALEALSGMETSSHQAAITAGKKWLVSRLKSGPVLTSAHPEGSPFATAAAALGVLRCDPTPEAVVAVEDAARWLMAQQQPDGGWAASARLRLPPPDAIHVEDVAQWEYTAQFDSGTIKFDHKRIFTTATVLLALASIHHRFEP